MALLYHTFVVYLCLAIMRNSVYIRVCTSSKRCLYLTSSFYIVCGLGALTDGDLCMALV